MLRSLRLPLPPQLLPPLVVKPTACDLATNLLVATDRRIYELTSTRRPDGLTRLDPRRDRQLRDAHLLAAEALPAFGLAEEDLVLLEVKQNATFRVDRRTAGTPDGERFLLRLCMPDRYRHDELLGKLRWLQSLRNAGLAVPEPVAARDGSLVAHLAVPGSPPRFAVLFRWRPGRTVQGALAELVGRAGRMLGRLHRHAIEHPPGAGSVRPRWGLDRLIGEREVLPADRLPADAAALLSPPDLALLREAAETVRAALGGEQLTATETLLPGTILKTVSGRAARKLTHATLEK
jgi:Ser/Thr protein kinase RdoA (MazF antagonist)